MVVTPDRAEDSPHPPRQSIQTAKNIKHFAVDDATYNIECARTSRHKQRAGEQSGSGKVELATPKGVFSLFQGLL
jgi:hypothetical protein